MTAKEQKRAAAEFAAKWSGKGYEKGECQTFWNTLLRDVFGVSRPEEWMRFSGTWNARLGNVKNETWRRYYTMRGRATTCVR